MARATSARSARVRRPSWSGFFGTPDGSAAGDGKFIGSQHFVDQVSR